MRYTFKGSWAYRAVLNAIFSYCKVKPGANESQKTRNKKQNGLPHSRFIVCVTPKQKKNIA